MIIIVLILLGLCFGSFVNAFVWRLHEQQKSKPKITKDLSILKGRSMCPDCQHTLAPKDLLPVFSWLSLGGKCRYCHKPISLQYPDVELFTAGLFVTSYVFWPYGFSGPDIAQLVAWLIILIIFMILFVYDLRWMLLPNKIVYPLIGLVVANVLLQFVLQREVAIVVQAFWGVVCIAGLFYAIFQLSGGKWIGGGDVKLAIALGMLVGGPVKALMLLFTASLLGVMVSLPLLVQGKKKYTSRIPFGPFLIAATFIVYIFGDSLINLYLKNILGL